MCNLYSHKSIPFRNPFHSVPYCNNTTSLTNIILVINIAIVRNNDILGSSRRRLNILCFISTLSSSHFCNCNRICFDIPAEGSVAKYYGSGDDGYDLNDFYSIIIDIENQF